MYTFTNKKGKSHRIRSTHDSGLESYFHKGSFDSEEWLSKDNKFEPLKLNETEGNAIKLPEEPYQYWYPITDLEANLTSSEKSCDSNNYL